MLLSAPAQGKDSSPIHGSSTRRGRHRCGHDGQRKCVAHMPTAATTTEDSRSKFGRKLPTRLHDEAINYFFNVEIIFGADGGAAGGGGVSRASTPVAPAPPAR